MKRTLIAAAAGVFAMATQLPAGFACDPSAASGSSRSAALAATAGACGAGRHWQDAHYDHFAQFEPGHCVAG